MDIILEERPELGVKFDDLTEVQLRDFAVIGGGAQEYYFNISANPFGKFGYKRKTTVDSSNEYR